MLRQQRCRHFTRATSAGSNCLLRLNQLRETEIQNLGMAVARNHYVVRLEIAMDNVRGVCFCESSSNVLQILQELREIGLLLMNQLTQSQAIDEFHGDEVHSISFTNFVDVRDVRMVQPGGSLRLLSETPHSVFIRRDFGWQNFQGDAPS